MFGKSRRVYLCAMGIWLLRGKRRGGSGTIEDKMKHRDLDGQDIWRIFTLVFYKQEDTVE